MFDLAYVRGLFQSVLQQANSLVAPANDHLLGTIQEHYGLGAALTKKQGVSGQSIDPAKTVQLQKIEKDIRQDVRLIFNNVSCYLLAEIVYV